MANRIANNHQWIWNGAPLGSDNPTSGIIMIPPAAAIKPVIAQVFLVGLCLSLESMLGRGPFSKTRSTLSGGSQA